MYCLKKPASYASRSRAMFAVILGACYVAYFLFFFRIDVSGFVNQGLLSDRNNGMIASVALATIGGVFLAVRPSEPCTTFIPAPPPLKPAFLTMPLLNAVKYTPGTAFAPGITEEQYKASVQPYCPFRVTAEQAHWGYTNGIAVSQFSAAVGFVEAMRAYHAGHSPKWIAGSQSVVRSLERVPAPVWALLASVLIVGIALQAAISRKPESPTKPVEQPPETRF